MIQYLTLDSLETEISILDDSLSKLVQSLTLLFSNNTELFLHVFSNFLSSCHGRDVYLNCSAVSTLDYVATLFLCEKIIKISKNSSYFPESQTQ